MTDKMCWLWRGGGDGIVGALKDLSDVAQNCENVDSARVVPGG